MRTTKDCCLWYQVALFDVRDNQKEFRVDGVYICGQKSTAGTSIKKRGSIRISRIEDGVSYYFINFYISIRMP